MEANWQATECVPADLPPVMMFDPVEKLDSFESSSLKWVAMGGGQYTKAALRFDPAEVHGGKGSLRVDYQFVGKPDYEYIQVRGQGVFSKPGLGFGFWLKHDGTPFSVRVRFTDAGGEYHQVDLLSSPTPGWQFVAGSLDGRSKPWGGDGNLRKDYPCKLAGICLDRPRQGFVGKGSLWIDDVAIVRLRPESRSLKVEVEGKRFGNLYTVGETVALRASGAGQRVRWSMKDFFGRELGRGDGPASGAEARIVLGQPGWFVCRLELISAGRVEQAQLFPCAALRAGSEQARSDFVGMNSHFGQNVYPLETMDLMQRYGIDQFRDEISWGSYEAEKGRLAMPAHAAAYLQRAAELRMRPLVLFDYANRHYDQGGFPNSPEAIAAFARYALDLARQARGKVGMFEVWNEWVDGCGMRNRPGTHDGEAYGRLLKPTYQAVKQAFPELTVVGIGGEYGPKCAENILDAVRTAGAEAMDAWSIHPYRYPRSPEGSDLVGEVTGIAHRVAKAAVESKAWITEIGYPTHRTSGGSDLAAQARHAVRTLALLQSTRAVEKVFWYDFKDDGVSRDFNEHNFGVVHHQRFNCAPKPAAVAISAFIRTTANAEFQDLDRAGDFHCARYRRNDGTDVLLIWTSQGTRRVAISGQAESAYDLMGAVLPAGVTEATESPSYVIGRQIRADSRP